MIGRIGLAGATGSWGSVRSYLRYHLGFGGAYRQVFGSWSHTRRVMARIGSRRETSDPNGSRLRRKFSTLAEMRDQVHYFGSFPNHHVRTNTFMISGEVWGRLTMGQLERKVDAYRVESGHESITRQVERLGLRPVVVSRDGAVHGREAWPSSNVFWRRRQEGLLVADNQTRDYDRGDPEIRLLLSRYAWGRLADIE